MTLGDTTPASLLPATGPVDPIIKAQLLAAAAVMPDERAVDVLEIAEATPYATRTLRTRYAIAGGLGLAVGVLGTLLFRGR